MHAIFKKSTGSSVWASEDKLNALYRAHDHLNTELFHIYNKRPDDDLCEIIRTYIELGFLQLMKMPFGIRRRGGEMADDDGLNTRVFPIGQDPRSYETEVQNRNQQVVS